MSTRRRYYLPLSALLVLVVAVALAPSSTTHQSATTSTSAPTYGLQGHPSQAIALAIQSATNAYRTMIVQAGQGVADGMLAIKADVQRGDMVAARRDWEGAQTSYDYLRGPILANSSAALLFDGRLSDQPFAMGRSGLHALEQDLFSGDSTHLAYDLSQASQLGLVLELSLVRTPATPAAMLTNGELQLSWAVDDCIAEHEELYAHLDFMDVAAQVQAVTTIVDAVTPLASQVAPGDLDVITQRLTNLRTTVVTLGAPSTRVTSSITSTTWRAISQQITALLEPISTLAGDLYGYGTGRTYA